MTDPWPSTKHRTMREVQITERIRGRITRGEFVHADDYKLLRSLNERAVEPPEVRPDLPSLPPVA